jgi:hypothetical protein
MRKAMTALASGSVALALLVPLGAAAGASSTQDDHQCSSVMCKIRTGHPEKILGSHRPGK